MVSYQYFVRMFQIWVLGSAQFISDFNRLFSPKNYPGLKTINVLYKPLKKLFIDGTYFNNISV